jgi:hypothetical protein
VKKNSYYEITPIGKGPPVIVVIPVIFTVVLVANRRCRHRQIAYVLEFLIIHQPPPLPLPRSDEIRNLFDLLLPPHVVPAAAPPGNRICNVVVCRAVVILASSASHAAASAATAPMLRGHLLPRVVS